MDTVTKVVISSCLAVLLCMAMFSPPNTEAAVTCGQVARGIGPCMAYLKGSQAPPSAACCSGIKGLNSAAATPVDRQTACQCLKNLAKSVSGINIAAASKLPGLCGVNVPFPISLSTDCAKYVFFFFLSFIIKLQYVYSN